jgi:hypothetical protein
MQSTQSTHAAAVKPAMPAPPEVDVRREVRNDLRNSVRRDPAAARKSSGLGLPCANCHLYYPGSLDACPTCNSEERVSANAEPVKPKVQAAAEPAPDTAVLEKEREAFLKEFKSQLFAAHAEVATSTGICTLAEHHVEGAETAAICKGCYDRLQERVDVCEAALHIDLQEATQIVYDAVWADSSDPSKTYSNAAGALLSELRKRSGVSSLLGPFHPLSD